MTTTPTPTIDEYCDNLFDDDDDRRLVVTLDGTVAPLYDTNTINYGINTYAYVTHDHYDELMRAGEIGRCHGYYWGCHLYFADELVLAADGKTYHKNHVVRIDGDIYYMHDDRIVLGDDGEYHARPIDNPLRHHKN